MALESRTEEAKPYDVVIDAFWVWHASYMESAKQMLEFVRSFESELKKPMTFLVTMTSAQTQRDVEREIISAFENLMHSTQRERNLSPELSSTAKLLITLAENERTETLLLAIQTDFDKYSELQKNVLELRRAYRQQDVSNTSEYLSLHELVIGDNQQFPETDLISKATLCLRITFHLSANRTSLSGDDAHSRETDNANPELASNRIKQILEDFFENDMIKAEQLAKLWPPEVLEAAFDEVMEIVSQLRPSLERWVLLRHQTVECLREMSKDLHDHNKNVAISQTVASSTGILATVLGIIGIALIPVTLGASLGLTITGAILGGASALTHFGSTITKHAIDKTKRRTLEELVKKEKEELGGKEDVIINQEIDITEENMIKRALKERLFMLHPWVQANRLRHERSRLTNEVNDSGITALRITLPVVYFVTGASSGLLRILAPLEIGAAAAGAATRVSSRLVLGVVGGALSVVALPIDIVSVILLANELKGGAKSTTGEEFSRMADIFEAEVKSIQSLLEYED